MLKIKILKAMWVYINKFASDIMRWLEETYGEDKEADNKDVNKISSKKWENVKKKKQLI